MANPVNAGPNSDGSKSLAKESKAGLAVAFITTAVVDAAISALTNIDLDSQQGWWVQLATVGVATALGLLTAWRKKNR
jgi:hypothetical protein